MAKLIPLAYVGKKPAAFDNIARSGVTWNGPGDVQEVTDAQAKLLLKFPDQWQLANPKDAKKVETPDAIQVLDELGGAVTIDPEDLRKPVEKMNKLEMVALSQDRWGKILNIAMSPKAMRDQIEEWENDADVVTNRPGNLE